MEIIPTPHPFLFLPYREDSHIRNKVSKAATSALSWQSTSHQEACDMRCYMLTGKHDITWHHVYICSTWHDIICPCLFSPGTMVVCFGPTFFLHLLFSFSDKGPKAAEDLWPFSEFLWRRQRVPAGYGFFWLRMCFTSIWKWFPAPERNVGW